MWRIAIESLPLLVGDHHRPLDDRLGVEDRHLRQVDHRRGHDRAVAAGVRDRERAAADVVGRELVVARLARESLDRLAEPLDAEVLRVVDDRDDQAARAERHRDAEVDRLVLGERLALERGVERREVAQRLDRRARHVGQPGQAGLLAVGRDPGHVGLDDRRARRRRLERVDHRPADRLAHARERLALAGGRGSARPSLDASACAARPARRACRGSRCASAALPPRPVLEVGEDVGLAHAPAAAGALDLLEVDAVLGGDPHHHGRVAARAGAADLGRSRAGRSRRAPRWCRPERSPASPGASIATSASDVPPDATRPRTRAPRRAWRRSRCARARRRRRPSRRPRPAPPARARWRAPRRRCRSCRSRSRR